jgi:hypothetical protein
LSQDNAHRSYIAHPYLIAAYSVIALLAHNIEEVSAIVALRALVLSIIIGVLVYLVFKALLNDRLKAGLLATLVLGLFFSYGHVYDYLDQIELLGMHLGRHRLLAPLWLALFLGLCIIIFRARRPLQTWNGLLNVITAVALVFPLGQIGVFTVRSLSARSENIQKARITNLTLPSGRPAPDIYYIILDAYARDDVLKKEFDLDTIPFLSQIEQLGFYIARCSQSNYAQTQLSLSSSLNMNYLQDLVPGYSPDQKTRVGLEEMIHHSAVRRAFEGLGYKIVAFETGFKGTQWEDADLYLSPSSDILHSMQIAGGPNGFEVMLMRSSAGLLLADGATVLPKFLQPDFDNPRKIHRDLVLFDLEQLAQLPQMPGPKFVFAHLVIPHPPYVFGANGEFTDFDKDYVPGYRDQVIYLNTRLLELLPKMIASSPIPPIIILQGDHGSIGSKPGTRTSNFNAYFLPDGAIRSLYPSISPANSFRVVFNQFFGGNYTLLEDVSYYSIYSAPFDFTIIPNKRSGCNP